MYIELYRGSVNTWEADHLGHMNVRFYVAKQMEGLAIMAPYLGLSRSFRPGWASTILPKEQHIRFISEVIPGRPIYMVGGVLEVRESSVLIYQELRHSIDDRPAASFRTWVHHVQSSTGREFPWRQKTLDAFAKYEISPPEETAPRSVDLSKSVGSEKDVTIELAEKLGTPIIGRGCIPEFHCDFHDRMRPEFVIGRLSESASNLPHEWRDGRRAAETANDKSSKVFSAALEYRIAYRAWPTAGDIFEVRTGFGGTKGRLYSLVHWMVNPITGIVYSTSEAWYIRFDATARKALHPDSDDIAALENLAPKGLFV